MIYTYSGTQPYFDSKCAFTCVLHGSACTRFLYLHVWSCVLCVFTCKSLRRADPSSRGVLPRVYVSLSVIKRNFNPLHLQWVGRRGRNNKERREKRNINRNINSILITGFNNERMNTVPQSLTYVIDTKPDIAPSNIKNQLDATLMVY